ncbi:amino acid ABC transporter permease [Geminicoccaceae bacterium 1502E]|nr:amino acid ABC transporter permease [Geminicoccaceae bacterium 1502E]
MAADLRSRPKTAFYNDPRVRGLLYQALALAAVVALGAFLIGNTLENRARLGVASGFGFLGVQSGFDISQSLIAYSSSFSSYGNAFVVGLLNTFYVAIFGIALATIIGFVMGIARLSSNWLVAQVALVYIEIIRNVPLLLQLIFWYTVVLAQLPSPADSMRLGEWLFFNIRGLFLPMPVFEKGPWALLAGLAVAVAAAVLFARWARRRFEATGQRFPAILVVLPMLLLVPLAAQILFGGTVTLDYPQASRFRISGGLTFLPEFMALLLGLSVYTGAFIAEIVRSGILAVSKGQLEAASALGLKPNMTLRLVVVPQALRVIIPPLTSQYLNLTKNSSLAVAIGYPDFFSIAGTINNQTGQAVEVIAITMGVYLTLSLLISAFMNWYNAHVALVER